MMKKLKKETKIQVLIALLACGILFEAGIVFFGCVLTTNSKAMVLQNAALKDYTLGEKLEVVQANEELAGVSCEWRFLQCGVSAEDLTTVDTDTIVVSENPTHNEYAMQVRIKNETAEDISGLRLFCSLPTVPGLNRATCDAVSFLGWLEYQGKTAGTKLDFLGGGNPMYATFAGGFAGWIKKADHQRELIPIYQDDCIGQGVVLPDYWRDEGMELDIPAGEEWILQIYFSVSPIYHFTTSAVMHPEWTMKHGSSFVELAPFGNRRRKLHISTETTFDDDIPVPIMLWASFEGDAELVPGTLVVDGKPVDDLVPQRGCSYDVKNFKPITIKDSVKKGDVVTVEYDVMVEIGQNTDCSVRIMNDIFVDGIIHNNASTSMSYRLTRWNLPWLAKK